MQKGWNAAGLLQPLWGRVGGREELARITGIHTSTLSGMNSGRLRLGRDNALKLATALHVSLAELGAPEGEDESRRSLTLRARLEKVEASLAELARVQTLILDELALAVNGETQPASRKAPARARKRGRRG